MLTTTPTTSTRTILFAKVVDLNAGHDNGKQLIDNGYKNGDILAITKVDMGSSYTWITAMDGDVYNSVHFEFFDDQACLVPHDIYDDPMYNPYIR